MLNTATYRDNNNFIQYNKVETEDWLYSSTKHFYSFLSNIQGAAWTSKLYLKDEMVSLDGGLTEINTLNNLMLGMYFFVADSREEHSRQVYTFTSVLSETGGISSSLIAIIGGVVTVINYYIYVMHVIHLLYFVREEKQESGFFSKLRKRRSD